MRLAALQRDFRTWLTREAPDAALRIDRPEGFGASVYLNNYRGQLMHCLSESFPVTRTWLGEDAFAALAADHVERVAPHRWTLDAYAEDFPASAARLYPHRPELAELAAIEGALGAAFVGADAAPVDPSGLAAIDWDAAVLHFVPTLSLLTLTTTADAIWSAIAGGTPPPAAERHAEPVTIAMWRQAYVPGFRILDPAEANALRRAIAGQPFGALCAQLVMDHGEADGTALAGAYLGRWLGEAMVGGIGVSP